MKDLKTPAIIAAIIMVIHIFLCFGLAMPLRHGGIALAGSAAAALNVIMLYYILRRRIGILGTRTTIRSLTKIIIASAIMGIFIAIVNFFIDSKLITSRLILLVFVFAIILFASLIYVAACKFMRCQELEEFVKLIRKKISKT
jgi:putative peptidoglycan lipid II flippase